MSTSQISAKSWIEKTPGVCGGDACIRRTRHSVVGLVEWRKLGVPDDKLKTMFDPPLTQADLDVAWQYSDEHREEIEQRLWENNACTVETRPIPVSLLIAGRVLGMSDERIRNAFDPPLSQPDLDAAWQYYEQHREEIELDAVQSEGY